MNSTSDKSNGDVREALLDSIKPSRHPSNTQRIAPWLIYCTIITTLLLLFTISFLAFLWYSQSSNPFWQKIVLGNWVPISVTLSAIALRAAITLQAGIATSMLASLVIEGTGVRLTDLPEISIMIFSNSGPHTLLWSYMKQPKSGGLMFLLIMLTFSTLAAQFSSTILLSDVALMPTAAAASDAHIAYGMDALDFEPLRSTPHWTQAMTQYPVFGEFRDPPKLENGVDDTGSVIRSLLPISEVKVRERLRSYKGPAFVFDARTVCVQPNFLSLHVRGAYGTNETDSIPGFYGKVAPKHAVENSVFNMSGVAFDCRIPFCPVDIDTRCRNETWAVCSLGTEAGGLISAMDPTNNASLQHSMNLGRATYGYEYLWVANDGNESWPVELGKGYLMFNLTTVNHPLHYHSLNHTHNDGPWASFEFPRKSDSQRGFWSASLCYNALPSSQYKQFQDFNVTLSRKDWRGEPTVHSKDITVRAFEDDNLSSKLRVIKGYDTSDILKQLGVFKHILSTEERDIMELTREELQVSITNAKAEFRPNLTSNTGITFEVFPGSFTRHFGQNSTYSWIIDAAEPVSLYGVYRQLVLCSNCIDTTFKNDSLPKTFASALLATVFNDALTESGSPAFALQAYFTSVLRMAYYTGTPLFNVQGNMTTISFVDCLIPASRRGFWGVMAIIAIHITICASTSIAFLSKTKFSMVGNIWPIFSQVARSNEVQAVLQVGTNKTDKEEARIYKNSHASGKTLRLRLVEKDGVVAFASIPVR